MQDFTFSTRTDSLTVVTLAECLGVSEHDQYKRPAWTSLDSIAPNGCLLSGQGFCASFQPFKNKNECFYQAASCFMQADDCQKHEKDQSPDHGHLCHDLRGFCQSQVIYCGECGKPNHPSCDSKDFSYRSHHHRHGLHHD